MGEWDGFLAEDRSVAESSASLGYSETEAVAVEEHTEISFAVEAEVDVHEVHVVETVEVAEVSEVSFESYLSAAETYTLAGSHESEASLGHTAEDSGLPHHDDTAHDHDPSHDGLDLF